MKSAVFALALTGFLVVTSPHRMASAQGLEQHPHEHDRSERLGQVNFKVTCKSQVQRPFNRAVAWLHSFEYEQAEKVFRQISMTDPTCGMAHWGVAMSNYHPLWAPPTAAELQKGWHAIEEAKIAGAQTKRERDYIAAIEVFYREAEKLDHRTRSFAYSDAMRLLSQQNPSDREAGVFYALSLIATGMMVNDKSYSREKEAAQILNRVLARAPRHPGVAHYLIHSYDYPRLAHLALAAARSYAKIAPASSHAQHMPSHIFTRLGLWDEAIQSNLDAKASAKAYAVRNRMAGAWDEQLHAMDYLAYAYLQRAQDKRAMGVLEELNTIQRAEPENLKVAYAFTAIPARYTLERRQWDDAARLPLHPSNLQTFPWERFRWAEAHTHFARAIGAARTGNAAAARLEVEKLATIRNALVAVKGDYDWGKKVEIEYMVALAWLAYAEGKHEESLRLMRSAADLDDTTDKHPVTPGSILPAREQLGELLLELKKPSLALLEFETSLDSAPQRFNGLYGAARAARFAADQKKAKSYYAKLVTLGGHADSTRPEIQEARVFLTNVEVKDAASNKRNR